MQFKRKAKLSVWQLLAFGYLLVILLGSILLSLPVCAQNGAQTTYTDALFTSVSATCVTGLVPVDTGTHWSLGGQIVILCLIQIGGLGFMTLVSVLFAALKRNMGLYGRIAFMQSAGEGRLSGIKAMIKAIFIGTGIFEGMGAVLLSFRFIPDFGVARGIYYAVWHSVSAFCNAGFDLLGGTFGGGKYVSFTYYAGDPLVLLTLSFLIIVGGLGFCVWGDLVQNKGNVRRCTAYTKMILLVNMLLLLSGTLLFFFFEKDAAALEPFTTPQKWLISFFNAVSPRTAGFNVIDLSTLSDSSYLLTLVLMFVGGSSGSTAGGIKIGTITVIILGMFAVFRGKRDINIGKRRIDNSLLNEALAIFAACLFLIIACTLAICAIEPNGSVSFMAVLFETVSALGTVGLTLSLTPSLSLPSKCIIMLLMYAGRVGILTLALALGKSRTVNDIRKPKDNFLIG